MVPGINSLTLTGLKKVLIVREPLSSYLVTRQSQPPPFNLYDINKNTFGGKGIQQKQFSRFEFKKHKEVK